MAGSSATVRSGQDLGPFGDTDNRERKLEGFLPLRRISEFEDLQSEVESLLGEIEAAIFSVQDCDALQKSEQNEVLNGLANARSGVEDALETLNAVEL